MPTHPSLGHHTSCDGYILALEFIKAVFDLLTVMCLVIFGDNKRIFSVLLQLRKFLAAHLSQLVQIWFLSIFLLLCQCLFSFLTREFRPLNHLRIKRSVSCHMFTLNG